MKRLANIILFSGVMFIGANLNAQSVSSLSLNEGDFELVLLNGEESKMEVKRSDLKASKFFVTNRGTILSYDISLMQGRELFSKQMEGSTSFFNTDKFDWMKKKADDYLAASTIYLNNVKVQIREDEVATFNCTLRLTD